MPQLLVPFSFIGFDAVIYLLASVIGFTVAFYALKMHNFTSNRSHFFLYLGFVVLSMGFFVLSISGFYTFFALRVSCIHNCYALLFDQSFDVIDFGYYIYYLSSLVAYGLFVLMYLPLHRKDYKQKMFSVAPLWFVMFPFFHMFSIFLIAYVVFRSWVGFLQAKNYNSLSVFAAFLSIGAFHTILLLNIFSKEIYVLAHFILVLGFLSLLTVLIRIIRKKPSILERL
ncbi:MAG: hypothetical protein ISS36_02395 [Candidatus Aenigmarchaeota archaeon]|nr:hypothetical protein [Candidatus Aenigmarchaeota archaeon]